MDVRLHVTTTSFMSLYIWTRRGFGGSLEQRLHDVRQVTDDIAGVEWRGVSVGREGKEERAEGGCNDERFCAQRRSRGRGAFGGGLASGSGLREDVGASVLGCSSTEAHADVKKKEPQTPAGCRTPTRPSSTPAGAQPQRPFYIHPHPDAAEEGLYLRAAVTRTIYPCGRHGDTHQIQHGTESVAHNAKRTGVQWIYLCTHQM